ncbi:hypothetical protein CHARACLAT_019607 [Characodon lateralis]|uniref:Uncharacterized protein n=1 Tax=Characodon lateralis TaxID=208331 RepID=A0ABU7F5E2_9TELE|nr:hypothetical protein [Characodon lateralis]
MTTIYTLATTAPDCISDPEDVYHKRHCPDYFVKTYRSFKLCCKMLHIFYSYGGGSTLFCNRRRLEHLCSRLLCRMYQMMPQLQQFTLQQHPTMMLQHHYAL